MTQSASVPSITLPPEPICYEDFLAWGLRADIAAEWVDGRIVPMRPNTTEHQRVVGFLHALLRTCVDARGSGELFFERMQMKTGTDLPGREPDILFVAATNNERVRHAHIEGPADLAVEVMSDESRARDRGEKFYEYEQGGVREYWLVDPDRQVAEFYVLGDDGRYRLALMGSEGRYESTVIAGFWIEVAWLWERPNLLVALDALGLR